MEIASILLERCKGKGKGEVVVVLDYLRWIIDEV